MPAWELPVGPRAIAIPVSSEPDPGHLIPNQSPSPPIVGNATVPQADTATLSDFVESLKTPIQAAVATSPLHRCISHARVVSTTLEDGSHGTGKAVIAATPGLVATGIVAQSPKTTSDIAHDVPSFIVSLTLPVEAPLV